jgi:hypothetical protein
MNKFLVRAAPLALIAAHAAAAPPAGWGRSMVREFGVAIEQGGASLVLAQARRGGGAQVNRPNVNRANVNRTNVNRNFNSANFQRNVTVNRNVSVSGNYGPNRGGVAAGAGVTAVASAAARSASYPPPPPYSYDPYYQYGY